MSDDPYCLFKIFAQKHPNWFSNDGLASLLPYNLKKMGKAVTSLLVSQARACCRLIITYVY